jgi:hypothetical protein
MSGHSRKACPAWTKTFNTRFSRSSGRSSERTTRTSPAPSNVKHYRFDLSNVEGETDPSDLPSPRREAGPFDLDSGDDPRAAHAATGSTVPLSSICDLDGGTLHFHDELRRQIIFARVTVSAQPDAARLPFLSSNETLKLTPHEGVFRRSAEPTAIYRRLR